MSQLALSNVGARAAVQRFGSFGRLTVRQRRRWLEAILAFEMKNQYEVFDESQQAVLRVQEEGEGFISLLKRLFLGPVRPFDATVSDAQTAQPVLSLKRPWRWMFHRIEVRSPAGESIGAIEKRWSWVRRIYTISDASGREIGQVFGPFLKPWTFEILRDGRQVGAIKKRWSGLGREMFTDADNFGVDLLEIGEPELKALAFAATVLIDVVHFERAKG